MVAEGMSTCNISLLIAIDKGLFLETTFLKRRSCQCWAPGRVLGSSDGHMVSWKELHTLPPAQAVAGAGTGGCVTHCASTGQDAWGQRECPGEDLAEREAFHVGPKR